MINLRLLALFLLIGGLLDAPASAQDRSPQFGFTIGLNLATLEAPTADVGTRQLLAGGLVAQMDVVGALSVEGQLRLAQKGAVVREDTDAIRYGVTYVDLPLLLRVEGPSLGSVTLYGRAGGFGGVKVFETQRAGSRGLSLPLEDLGTDASVFRRTNAGVRGGLGAKIAIGRGRRLNLAAQYSHGLIDVAQSIDDHPFSVPFPSEAYTRTVSIMLRFGL